MIPLIKPQDRARDRWITVEPGPTLIVNAAFGFHHRVLLTENAVLHPPLNGTNGQRILIRIEQPASGKTVTLHSALNQRGDVVISTTAGSVSILDLIYDHVAGAWDVRGFPDLSTIYDDAGTAAAAVSTHAGESDPHPVYMTMVETAASFQSKITANSGWTVSNYSSDKVIDAATPTIAETTNALCTLIDALKAQGILS